MKRVVVIGILLVAILQTMGQVPQKFSYQAVLRNADGTVMAGQAVAVMVSLHKVATDGEVVYSEVHSATTSSQGVIALPIGGGTVESGVFASIPWSENIFIQIDVKKADESTYQTMGTSQILSVPYAITAGSVKEVASSSSATDDEPIFVVKNKNGEIVFAVYQGGVRVYVDDSSTKGVRGGFAVGGLSNQSKGTVTRDLLFVDSDSTRVCFNNTAKGVRGGFAVGGLSNQSKSSSNKELFEVTSDSTYFNTTILTNADIITTGNVSTGAGVTSESLVFDGYTYKTVKIGNQIWMKENLRSTHYSNGDTIIGNTYIYDDHTTTPDTLNSYGRLYSYAAIDSTSTTTRVCPDGWHVPTILDWKTLMAFVGGADWLNNATSTGLKLMETGTTLDGSGYWGSYNNASNVSGFTGRPGGLRDMDGIYGSMGMSGYWWAKYAYNVTLDSSGYIYVNTETQSNSSEAYSVRCIKDSGSK
jgi:uncharacterized protein (TIGR02145 family)